MRLKTILKTTGHLKTAALLGLLSFFSFACSSEVPATAAHLNSRFLEISVDAVDQLLQKHAALLFDANGPQTRDKFGIVPGATLLPSPSHYDVATTLPTDKDRQLIFYCASKTCSSSDGAAARAQGAGYKNVAVMRVGISGWVKAGKTVKHVRHEKVPVAPSATK